MTDSDAEFLTLLADATACDHRLVAALITAHLTERKILPVNPHAGAKALARAVLHSKTRQLAQREAATKPAPPAPEHDDRTFVGHGLEFRKIADVPRDPHTLARLLTKAVLNVRKKRGL